MTSKLMCAVSAVVALGLGSGAAHAAERYALDPGHTFVSFTISHLGYSVMHGRFNDVSGEFTYDPDTPANSSIRVEVKTASIDTNHAKRDKHLRSEDFLGVDQHPLATFQSTGMRFEGDDPTISGDLTLHGVTRPVTIAAQFVGAGKDPWGGYRRGYVGTLTLRRSDFGMGYDLGPAAETMQLQFTIEGVRQ